MWAHARVFIDFPMYIPISYILCIVKHWLSNVHTYIVHTVYCKALTFQYTYLYRTYGVWYSLCDLSWSLYRYVTIDVLSSHCDVTCIEILQMQPWFVLVYYIVDHAIFQTLSFWMCKRGKQSFTSIRSHGTPPLCDVLYFKISYGNYTWTTWNCCSGQIPEVF